MSEHKKMESHKTPEAALDLTPPTKKATVTKIEKAPKAPKAEKAAADPNAPKKDRAARVDYGFNKDAIISVIAEKAEKYNGQRKEWFALVSEFDGKPVSAFLEAAKAAEKKDPPRGWLRFYVKDGSITLSTVASAA